MIAYFFRIVCKTEPVDDPLSGDVSVSVKTHDTVSFSGRFHYRVSIFYAFRGVNKLPREYFLCSSRS